jgi:hypothetical protein
MPTQTRNQRRIINADKTIETDLFGFSWPLRHRVVPNAATRRWCDDDGKANALPAALNAASRPLSVPGCFDAGALMRLQPTARPFFAPLPPVAGMPIRGWTARPCAPAKRHCGSANSPRPGRRSRTSARTDAPAASAPTRTQNRPSAWPPPSGSPPCPAEGDRPSPATPAASPAPWHHRTPAPGSGRHE